MCSRKEDSCSGTRLARARELDFGNATIVARQMPKNNKEIKSKEDVYFPLHLAKILTSIVDT